MSRYEKILALTIHELHFYLENTSHLPGVAKLFAQGGFYTYTDEELDKVFYDVFAGSLLVTNE